MKNKYNFTPPLSVLIPDGENIFASLAIHCLGKLKNISIYVLSNTPLTRSRFSRYTNYFFSYQEKKTNKLEAIKELLIKNRIDIVLPVDEFTIRLLSKNKNKISHLTSIAPCPQADIFDIVKNKWTFSLWLKKNDFPIPFTILHPQKRELEGVISKISFPVLIKPLQDSNGNKIKYFKDAESLINYSNKNFSVQDYIIQEFVHGYDVSCSVLCQEGRILAHTIQKGINQDPLNFQYNKHIIFMQDEKTYILIKEIVRKLNWTGVANFDLRYDKKDNQLKILELNPRYWGTLLGSFYAGVNFPFLSCLTGLNIAIDVNRFQPVKYIEANQKNIFKVIKLGILQTTMKNKFYDYSNLRNLIKDPLHLGYIISEIVFRKIKIFYKAINHNNSKIIFKFLFPSLGIIF